MENNRFEDSFRNAFDGAEVSPSAAVWTNIELDLEKTSGGQLKRNLLVFQLLAAASVAFAFGIAALYYLQQPVTKHDSATETISKHNSAPLLDSAKQSTEQKIKPDESIRKDDTEKSIRENLRSFTNEQSTVSPPLKEQPQNSLTENKLTRKDLSDFVQTKKLVLNLPREEEERVEPDAGMVLLARLKDEQKKYQDEEKKTAANEKLWASVGFGGGSYKPNRELHWNDNNSAESARGESYSVGVNVAGKISSRLIVQGGISYLAQSADFSSSGSNNGNATMDEFVTPGQFSQSSGPNNGAGIEPYTVNSSLQFVTIPVQVGYLVVDRAFGIQVNGGIATDLFISNTLSPESDSYQKVTQPAGKDSPYRTVNFSGLLGTEISYRIAQHYRISVNPGLRYSLNSIYKQGIAAEITPVTVDVSLRFRYIFK
jgi:hypothetical protein